MHTPEQDCSTITLSPRRWLMGLSIGLGLSLLAGYWLGRSSDVNAQETPALPLSSAIPAPNADEAKPLVKLFHNWPENVKPEVAIMLSAQMYGYIQPCGCSRPQLGGLERRYNFQQTLVEKGWPIVSLDLGDIANKKGVHKQSLLKYTLTMKALERMNYAVIGVGQQEFGLPLLDALASYTLQRGDEQPRVLAGNLFNRAENFPGGGKKPMIGSWEVIEGKHPPIGVVGLIGPTMARNIQQKINPQQQFENNKVVLTNALAEMAKLPKKPELNVLLYQGSKEEALLAANAFPEFNVILCQTLEEEPPAFPTYVGGMNGEPKRMIVTVGHKGRHVGVVGLFRNMGQLELKYHLVSLGEEFETPDGQDKGHPILSLFEDYTAELKRDNYLKLYPKVPHPVQVQHKEATYIGSKACADCHQAEYEVWENSAHAQAYDALEVVATKPSLRNFDGECIVCHTVGFNYQSGYVDAKTTPELKNVGCENCHGPGSLHVQQPKNAEYFAGLSPWKINRNDLMPSIDRMQSGEPLTGPEKLILNRVDADCQKCHDTDNDPHFRIEDKKYWPKIVHTGMQKNKKK